MISRWRVLAGRRGPSRIAPGVFFLSLQGETVHNTANARGLGAFWSLKPHPSDEIPALSWVAACPLSGGALHVIHGRFVESAESWIVEGCWAGDVAEGRFHEVENFFGSGVRVDGDKVFFCASVALVDRLFHAQVNGYLLVSNSLPLILAATNASLDYDHTYWDECHAQIAGLWRYPREFRVIHARLREIQQVFCANLVLSENGLEHEMRAKHRSIRDFEEYHSMMEGCVRAVVANAVSACRKRPMSIYSTVSAGYDSNAVTCLARPEDLRACFTTRPENRPRGFSLEDGESVARCLGVSPILLDPDPANVSCNELWFLAPTLDGSEVLFDSMVRVLEERDEPSVVLTGYHGDKVWDRATSGDYLSDDIRRGDTSGLNVSEVRLKAGFVNAAIPFLFARSVGDIVRISNSSEMAAWRLGTDYDRPIARRIVESFGVPRSLFGQRKMAVLKYYGKPINEDLCADFKEFLADEFSISKAYLRSYWAVEHLDYALYRALAGVQRPAISFKQMRPYLRGLVFRRTLDFNRLMFFWANDRLKKQLVPAVEPLLTSILEGNAVA